MVICMVINVSCRGYRAGAQQLWLQPVDVHHPVQQPDPDQPPSDPGDRQVHSGHLHQLGTLTAHLGYHGYSVKLPRILALTNETQMF